MKQTAIFLLLSGLLCACLVNCTHANEVSSSELPLVYAFERNFDTSLIQSSLLLVDYIDSIKTVRLGSIFLSMDYEEYLFLEISSGEFVNASDTIIVDRVNDLIVNDQITFRSKDTTFVSKLRNVSRSGTLLENTDSLDVAGKYFESYIDSLVLFFADGHRLFSRSEDSFFENCWYTITIGKEKYVVLDDMQSALIQKKYDDKTVVLYAPFYDKALMKSSNSGYLLSGNEAQNLWGQWILELAPGYSKFLGDTITIIDNNLMVSTKLPEYLQYLLGMVSNYQFELISELSVLKFDNDAYILIDSVSDSTLILRSSGLNNEQFKYTRK